MVAVNDSWRLCQGPDGRYFCDHIWATDYRWWKHWIATITDAQLDAQLWTQSVQWPDDNRPEAWGIHCLTADTTALGLSRDPAKVHTGQNSGYAALGLAYANLKAERIILLGYDMKLTGDKRHWFGAHPNGLEVSSNYPNFISQFKTIKPETYGLEIWNCTRTTALQHFPVYDLDEVCAALS